MEDGATLSWAQDRSDLRFPESGLLRLTADGELRGALGYRPGDHGCDLWFESGSSLADWPSLVDRVTLQARKAKYRRAAMATDRLPDDLRAALEQAGFSGDPLCRALICDAPDELQPYLDWIGRVTRIAEGKGSESINARLYDLVASAIPEHGRYSENEINALLRQLHLYDDPAGLRRELIDRGYLARTRDCRQYWKVQDPEIIGRT